MQVNVYPNAAALLVVNLVRTELANSVMKLYQNDYTPNEGTILADMTVATFSGYANKTVAALLPAYIEPAGGASAQVATVQWDHNGGATSNIIYGFSLENAGGDLILAGRFENPIPMASLGDSIPLDTKVSFSG